MEMKLAKITVLAALVATGASAQTNLGAQKPEARLPFVMTKVATFDLPVAPGLPSGRTDADHREGGSRLAGHPDR
jgi:aldose sugar dehydrogenase